MKTINQWLLSYGASHQHPRNILIHKFCVPAILFAVLGLLWQLPPIIEGRLWSNLAIIACTTALLFYSKLSPRLCVGMTIVMVLMLTSIYRLQDDLKAAAVAVYSTVFVMAWVFQFIGHQIEGRKPSFVQDLVFLLIGPLWCLNVLYGRFGIKLKEL